MDEMSMAAEEAELDATDEMSMAADSLSEA